ncbi:type II secretion system protein D (GspD) [Duganella sp. CF458]|uniref:type II secretion system secretin GspD n=1 Tax=Duganella sp. CF458 TaxID=1884368 RepID=UPI0008F2D641|nr:type II secretion system secretin GspD [Duganella sp. CF458]SFF68963.1 type II secretion system protein D (GspD) [Duganella sp. CF458]
MKTHTASPTSFPALRRLSAAALLCCALAPAAAPVPAWAQPNDEAALNFVGADIESVIKAVGHYTNITFLIDPRVKGTLTLVSEKSITKSQAFQLLASALRLQGYAIVSGDGYAKVVPEAEAKLQASPTVIGGQKSPQGDQIVTQVFHLNHENSANLVTVLRPLITPNNTINANPGNNTLVITDYSDNLKRLAKIVASLDAPSSADLDVVPVRYAIASDLAAMINKLMEPGAGGDSGRVTLVPDPRTNSLVVRAPSAARANLAKSLIAKLDQPTAQAGNVHVVYLKNAEATKLAETLRSVVSGDGGSSQSGSNSGSLSSLGGAGAGNSQMGQSGLGASSQSGSGQNGPSNPALQSGSRSGSQGGGGGSAGYIQADATTNTLIITAPEAVYRNLRSVIDQLDVRRAQVYIESMIVEVNADKLSEFGVQWAGLSGNSNSSYRIGGGTSFATDSGNNIISLNNLSNGATGTTQPTPPGAGLTLGVFKQLANGKLGLGAIAHALGSDGDSNILSTPNMITLDNEVATIKVGQNVPIVTGSYNTTAGTTSNPFTTVDRKDVGITLKVRPQISEGGTIKLAIYNESSSIDASVTSTSGLILKNRVIETNILADDGQVLILGGLIQDDTSDGVEKVPGLGDLPIIGNLFKYQKRSRKKTNLMVFLRPVVVRNREQQMSLTADRYDFIRASQEASKPESSMVVQDLGRPTLPELVNGEPNGGGQMVRPIPPAPRTVPEQKQQQ